MRKWILLLILPLMFLVGCTSQETPEPVVEVVVEEPPAPEIIEEPVVEEPVEGPEEIEEIILDFKEEEVLINGKTTEERLDEAIDLLHAEGSEDHLWENFLDLELVYTDSPSEYPENILPFEYYYSEEADRTFNLCNIERTVFICEGKLDHAATDEELNTICVVTPIYQDI